MYLKAIKGGRMDDKLKHSIFYFLHRYYPENKNNLTNED